MMERVLSWVLTLALAFLLLVIVFQFLAGGNPNPIFGMIALRSGLRVMEPQGRYAVSVLQLLAVALVLIPKTRGQGSALALVLALGAIALQLSPWLGVQLPQGPAVSQALAQGHSAADIAAMNLPTDKGGMFLLALAAAVLAGANIFVERANVQAAKRVKVKRPIGAFA